MEIVKIEAGDKLNFMELLLPDEEEKIIGQHRTKKQSGKKAGIVVK